MPVIVFNLVPLRGYLRWRLILPIVLGTAAGTSVGVWGLIRMPERALLVGLGIVILVALALSEIRRKPGSRKPNTPLALGVGVVGGAFGGAYSVSGPPVTLYLTSLLDDKHEIVRWYASQALETITGESLGTDAEEWAQLAEEKQISP